MHRWHGLGCKDPDVAVCSGTLRCNSCLAQFTEERDETEQPKDYSYVPEAPRLESRSHMNVTWPAAVEYMPANIYPEHARKPHHEAPSVETRIGFYERTGDRETRVLRLTPGELFDPIHGTLELLSLKDDDYPAYRALSYTSSRLMDIPHENYTFRDTIYIGPYWDIIYVSTNCVFALASLRRLDAELPIWVNTICIDLQDAADRTQQARLMRDIYSKASKVTVYLGENSPHYDLGSKLLLLIAKRSTVASRVASTDMLTKEHFHAIFDSICFRRIWVLHEILLAENLEILCGQLLVEWPCSSRLPFALFSQGKPWLFARKRWKRQIIDSPLSFVFDEYRVEFSDPRDRIFATLGLINKPHVAPDYSLPVEVIYTGYTAYLLKAYDGYAVLQLVRAKERNSCLPSWVPDWSCIEVPEKVPARVVSNGPGKPTFILDGLDFDNSKDSEDPAVIPKMCFSVDGSLFISATKIYDIPPTAILYENDDCPYIAIDRGSHGIVLIFQNDVNYQLGSDSVFLLTDWYHPVILRSHPKTATYSFVSTCCMYLSRPDGENFRPRHMTLSVSLTRNDTTAVWDLYNDLRGWCETKSLGRNSPQPTVIDFAIFSSTFHRVEVKIWDEWRELSGRLRWALRDQGAILGTLAGPHMTGDTTKMGHPELTEEQMLIIAAPYMAKLSPIYEWDLQQFFWSFLSQPITFIGDQSLIGPQNPMLKEIASLIPDLMEWARVTAELMHVIDLSRIVLGSQWHGFPGMDLPVKWRSKWRSFSQAIGFNGLNDDLPQDKLTDPTYFWNWMEAEETLNLREELLAQGLPETIDPARNKVIKQHMEFRKLGFHIDRATIVRVI